MDRDLDVTCVINNYSNQIKTEKILIRLSLHKLNHKKIISSRNNPIIKFGMNFYCIHLKREGLDRLVRL